MTILTFVIYLAVIWIIYWLACMILGKIPIPSPPANWIALIFLVVAVLATINLLLALVGLSTDFGALRLS